MKKARWILPAVCFGLAALVALPAAQADPDDDELVGTWRFTVASEFGPFFNYITFHEDHTVTETVTINPVSSIGIGVWEEIDGDDDSENFAVMFETFNRPNADSDFDGRIRVRWTVQLLEDDTLTGTLTIDIRNLIENALILSFTENTFVAQRMTVIRE